MPRTAIDWHLKLDQQSSRLTTFETPFARKRSLRLPFRTKPSAELFQARMNEAISGLKDVACIADDFLIAGSEQTGQEAIVDYNRNLRVLLDRYRERGIKLSRNKSVL